MALVLSRSIALRERFTIYRRSMCADMRHARLEHRWSLKLLATFGRGATILTTIFGLTKPRERQVEALVWLARLKRGLRETEGPRLLEWLHSTSHRKRIARMAAEWHNPEILAALGEMFPIDSALLEPPRPGRRPIESVAIALLMACFLPLFILVIHFVQVLHAGHYVGDRALHVSVLVACCALLTAMGALIVKGWTDRVRVWTAISGRSRAKITSPEGDIPQQMD
jgi:hypothetical protein